MPDWMGKLERAKGLLDSGALTPEEFEREKARLLHDETELEAGTEEGEESGFGWSKMALILACVMVVLFVAHWLWNYAHTTPSAENSGFSVPGLTDSPPAAAEEEATEAAHAEPSDLSSTLRFSDPSQCTAGGTLEKVFAKLDSAMNTQSKSQVVKLDEFADGFRVDISQTKNADGALDQSAEIKFDQATNWNGLRLSRIRAHLIAPPESDSSYSRIFTFREGPERVRSALSQLGISAPLEPGYSELSDGQSVCGGSMYIEAISGGAALNCGWGC